MRIPINLASEPFRRDRPLVVASTAVALLLMGSLLMFVWLAIAERQRSADARANLARMNTRLSAISTEQSKLEAILREPRNAEVLDRVQFVNALLARKGVSWTRMFGDLEHVIPHNVRLIQVRPQINPNNELILDMVVGSQTSEPVILLLTNMENSNVFSGVTVHASLPPSQTDPLFRYRVSVQYGQKL